jgi:hypothetical protein
VVAMDRIGVEERRICPTVMQVEVALMAGDVRQQLSFPYGVRMRRHVVPKNRRCFGRTTPAAEQHGQVVRRLRIVRVDCVRAAE